MADEHEPTALEEAAEYIQSIQQFDCEQLTQRGRLGDFHFEDAIAPARRLVSVFQQLPLSVLEVIPDAPLKTIRDRSKTVLSVLREILSFSVEEEGPRDRHAALVNRLHKLYDPCMNALYGWIAYATRHPVEWTRIEEEAHHALREVMTYRDQVAEQADSSQEEVHRLLEQIREAAGEQGVSQEAACFRECGKEHEKRASHWRAGVWWSVFLLAIYAIGSLWIHKWIKPENQYETIQLAVSKVLIFAVLSSMLYLCARNYLAGRHNAIVNRHRQDALTTYRALVESAGDAANRDIVLMQAAQCIFSPQPTGFSRGDSRGPDGIMSLLSQIAGGRSDS